MRVVGGQYRGRGLVAPAGQAVRPTSDRVREAIFNILAHGVAHRDLSGCKVLDLFAGTGALGIEALSRGAAQCLFVDASVDARGMIRANIEAFRLTGVTKVFKRDATALGEASQYGDFDLVFLDPPYGQGFGERALVSAAAGGWLVPGASVVWEERKHAVVPLPPQFRLLDNRIWGDTQVVFADFRG